MTIEPPAIRQRLLGDLASLSNTIEKLEAGQREPLDDDSAEQAIGREDLEAMDAIERLALAEAEVIQQALARLDAGTYGLCTACGNAIAPARLQVVPAAPRCIRCENAATGGGD